MIGPGWRTAGQSCVTECHELPRQRVGPGRLAPDIAHDIQGFAISGGAEDGSDEVPAVFPVEPRGAHHEAAVRQVLTHRGFARGLAAPVGVDRLDRRVLGVRGGGVP